MVKVQLGKDGGFHNIKNDCQHPNFVIKESGTYKYVTCRTCGRMMGEYVGKLGIQGKDNQGS